MLPKKLIDIIVLVYNRKSHFIHNFNDYCELAKYEDVNLVVLDDSSNNDIEEYLEGKSYSFLYLKNRINLGHDKNYFRGFEVSNSQYLLILSDYTVIRQLDIEILKSAISKYDGYPFIVLNTFGRLKGRDSLIDDKKFFHQNILWHITLTGSILFNNNFINRPLSLGVYKNFPHLSLAMNLFSQYERCFYLSEELFDRGSLKKLSYWNNNFFDVFLVDLFNVMHFNGCSAKESLEVCQIHAKYTKLFSFKYLLKVRIYYFADFSHSNEINRILPLRVKFYIGLLNMLPNKLIRFLNARIVKH